MMKDDLSSDLRQVHAVVRARKTKDGWIDCIPKKAQKILITSFQKYLGEHLLLSSWYTDQLIRPRSNNLGKSNKFEYFKVGSHGLIFYH